MTNTISPEPRGGVAHPPSLEPLSAVQARQGVISGRVVTVLAVSMTLAIIAMIVSFSYFS